MYVEIPKGNSIPTEGNTSSKEAFTVDVKEQKVAS